MITNKQSSSGMAKTTTKQHHRKFLTATPTALRQLRQWTLLAKRPLPILGRCAGTPLCVSIARHGRDCSCPSTPPTNVLGTLRTSTSSAPRSQNWILTISPRHFETYGESVMTRSIVVMLGSRGQERQASSSIPRPTSQDTLLLLGDVPEHRKPSVLRTYGPRCGKLCQQRSGLMPSRSGQAWSHNTWKP